MSDSSPDDDALRAEARKRVKAKRDFFSMLAIFVVVTVLLLVIWYVTSGPGSYFWPIWPIIGFVLATVFAALDAWGITRRFVTEADVDAEVERMTRRKR
ncbi:2TM domain-containing protein [Protaetiibacter mangrovi]|uniref:2TM domain-containing protein n=1 Tax=Protaetiibacter mangrovi TaxID=2970926 RepID=A0ABT1ZI19_9MICO|nr:2TM domain-containing protein [Protaetiibacter mangrovi]MCS0500337.1 2TM domain-containing protein [Protaetiibacter mangrovi]TPX00864.1 2TM domain-containing protein [Schumannella luteola]